MTIFSEPHGGLPYTEEIITPTAATTIVTNEKAGWILSALRRRSVRGQIGAMDATMEPYWSSTAKRFLAMVPDRFTEYNHDLEELRNTSISGPTFSSYAVALAAVEVVGAYRYEAFRISTAHTSAYYSTNGSSWSTFTIPSFGAQGRALWLGGPNNVRVVPGIGSGFGVLYVAGTTASTTVLHTQTYGTYGPQRIAHNGSGRIVVASPEHVWVNTDYGETIGNYSEGTLPTLASGTASSYAFRVGLDYDSTRELYVMVRAQTTGNLVFSTSSDGLAWQAWRQLPWATYATTAPWPDIAIINGAWIVSCADHDNGSVSGTAYFQHYFASIDGGATWIDLGRGASGPLSSAEGTGGCLACDSSVLGYRSISSEGGTVFDLIGPIDYPTIENSVEL